MHKLLALPVAATLGFAVSAHAADANHPDDFWTKVSVTASALYQNSNFDKLSPKYMGYEFSAQYSPSDYLYASVKAQHNYTGKWTYGVKVGAIYTTDVFSPYVEVGYDVSRGATHWNTDYDYDGGVFYTIPYHIIHGAAVFVEFDQFLTKRSYMTGGVKYQLMPRVVVGAQASYNRHTLEKQGKASLTYTL
ncbi:MAG: hypothetical protein ACPG47_00080 [Leucothrix sp.]